MKRMTDELYREIEEALDAGDLTRAQRLLDQTRKEPAADATPLYLQGRAYMKQAEWGRAISCFRQAEEIDPGSPARQCRMMLHDIMEFRHKDLYNP